MQSISDQDEDYLLIEINKVRKIISLQQLPQEQQLAHNSYLSAIAEGMSASEAMEKYTIQIIVNHPFQRDFGYEGWQYFLKHAKQHREKLESDSNYRECWEKQTVQLNYLFPIKHED